MMKIEHIWQELENEQSFKHGILLRRYSGSILPDIFVALKAPEKQRCIATLISKAQNINTSIYSNLKDISIEILQDDSREGRNILLFKLLNSQHKDIFSVLCEDLMLSIELVTNEKQLIKVLFERFEKWKSLFEISLLQGLNNEEQKGLYGELYLLRDLLFERFDKTNVIQSWVGCDKEVRDFQLDSWAIEVKSTSGNNHQRVHVSSERQLDISNLEYLFLFHLSLEKLQKSGETLNDMVHSIREIVQEDMRTLIKFNTKLIEGGYFDNHHALYQNTGYSIRRAIFYHVKGDFPRIEEHDIRSGVGDVDYTIILSEASEYIIDASDVFQKISFYD